MSCGRTFKNLGASQLKIILLKLEQRKVILKVKRYLQRYDNKQHILTGAKQCIQCTIFKVDTRFLKQVTNVILLVHHEQRQRLCAPLQFAVFGVYLGFFVNSRKKGFFSIVQSASYNAMNYSFNAFIANQIFFSDNISKKLLKMRNNSADLEFHSQVLVDFL